MKLLLAEDEKSLSKALVRILEKNNYSVDAVYDGAEAQDYIEMDDYDAIILDIMMPKMDGITVLKNMRARGDQTPVIMLTAKSEIDDKIEGLDTGANDYLTKPFKTAELLARIRVALRHARAGIGNAAIANTGKFNAGELTIDYDKHQVLISGNNCHLTQNEFRIVALLGRYAGRVLTYDTILKELWGPQSRGDNQILRVNMANIRRKIEKNPAEPQYIITEIGVGYRMLRIDPADKEEK